MLLSLFDYVRAGYFGASTGAAAALVAAAELGQIIGAIVSRGGRPDLAADSLPLVEAPTLLIVGGLEYPVIEMNRHAYAQLSCKKEIQIVSGATHAMSKTNVKTLTIPIAMRVSDVVRRVLLIDFSHRAWRSRGSSA